MLPYHTLSVAVVMKGVRKNIVTTPTTTSTEPNLYIYFVREGFKKQEVMGGSCQRGFQGPNLLYGHYLNEPCNCFKATI